MNTKVPVSSKYNNGIHKKTGAHKARRAIREDIHIEANVFIVHSFWLMVKLI